MSCVGYMSTRIDCGDHDTSHVDHDTGPDIAPTTRRRPEPTFRTREPNQNKKSAFHANRYDYVLERESKVRNFVVSLKTHTPLVSLFLIEACCREIEKNESYVWQKQKATKAIFHITRQSRTKSHRHHEATTPWYHYYYYNNYSNGIFIR